MHRHRLQRPAHADLEHANPDLLAQLLIDTQLFEGLAHVQIGLAGGDDAQPRLRRIDHHLVQLVGTGEGPGGVDLVGVESRLLGQRRVRPADVQTAFGYIEVVRDTGFDPQWIDLDHRGRVDVLGNGLHRHPATAVARQLPANDAVVENLLNITGVEHGDHRGDERMLTLVSDGR